MTRGTGFERAARVGPRAIRVVWIDQRGRTMVKAVVLYGPPADPDASERYYADTHTALAKAIPGLKRFEAARGVATPDGSDLPYQRIAELTFDDMNALQAGLGSAEGQRPSTTSPTSPAVASRCSSPSSDVARQLPGQAWSKCVLSFEGGVDEIVRAGGNAAGPPRRRPAGRTWLVGARARGRVARPGDERATVAAVGDRRCRPRVGSSGSSRSRLWAPAGISRQPCHRLSATQTM